MPASERRVVHMYLSEHPQVSTASSGEGKQRSVVISPRYDLVPIALSSLPTRISLLARMVHGPWSARSTISPRPSIFTDLIIATIWVFSRFKVRVPLSIIIFLPLNIFFSQSPLSQYIGGLDFTNIIGFLSI